MNLGQHAGFIVASYGAAVLILAALIAWVMLDHRAQRRALGELEARGAARPGRTTGGRPA
jgi:heme exporter protein D